MGLTLYFLGWLTKAEVAQVAAWIRKSSGVLMAAGGAFAITRNIGLAILAGMFAYTVMSRTGWYPGKGKETGAAGKSSVRSPYLEMTLDHATGAIEGRALRSRFAGRALSDFSEAERTEFLAELRANDAQGAQLFEAYLDRLSPGWREGVEPGFRSAAPSRVMTVDEAYMVLGLNRRATRGEVLAAHRNLMKRFHPDQGGSTYIAAQVNEAKDLLLKHIRT